MSRPRKGEEGAKEASEKWHKTMEARYGGASNFMRRIGAIGGKNGHTGGFAANPELARIAGAIGGSMSRRGPAIKKNKGSKPKPMPAAKIQTPEPAIVDNRKGFLQWFLEKRNK